MNYFCHDGASYSKFRPTYPLTLAQTLSNLTPEKRLALDVGCGNGQLTEALSPYFEQVIGVDPSAHQINETKAAGNVAYLQQSAEVISLSGNSVDLIVAAQSVHWFDLEKFYAEVCRIAKPDAAIALVSYGIPYIADPMNTLFQQAYWHDLHEFWPVERWHVETGYASLAFPFSPLDLASESVRNPLTVDQFIGYITTWSAYLKAVQSGNQHLFEAFFSQLRENWKAAELKEVIWPITVRAGRVHSD